MRKSLILFRVAGEVKMFFKASGEVKILLR